MPSSFSNTCDGEKIQLICLNAKPVFSASHLCVRVSASMASSIHRPVIVTSIRFMALNPHIFTPYLAS
jgi:hypothetical protein